MHSTVLLIGNFLSGSVHTRSAGEELALRLVTRGHVVCTASERRPRAARMVDMIATVFRERARYGVAQIDVYSGPGFIYAEAVAGLLRLLRKPYVLTLRGGNLPAFGRRWPRRVRRLLRSAAVVTAPSHYLCEQMRGYRDDIRVLPNALEMSAYPFHVREQPRPHIVWLRAFNRIYAPELAPAVLARLVASFPDARLTMIGPDKLDGSLEQTQRAATFFQVRDRLAFAGAVPKGDVPAWLDAADIFLNSTNVDNTPVSVLEAMACGLCIVSTRVGGIPYLLEDGEDALLVPPNDPDAMAEAVKRILMEPGLGARLSRNARTKAAQFDWRLILPRWETLLAELGQPSRRESAR